MKKAKFALTLIFAASLLLAACGGAEAEQTPAEGSAEGGDVVAEQPEENTSAGLCSNEYYPVAEGVTWTYLVSGAPTGDFSFTDTITNVRPDGFTLSANFDFEGGLQRTQEWACQPEGLVALTYGGGPSAALSTSGATLELTTTGVSGITLPADITVGSSWAQTLEVEGTINLASGMEGFAQGSVAYSAQAVGMETVTSTAGTFDAIKLEVQNVFNLTVSTSGIAVPVAFTGQTTVWYAPGVGMVKSVSVEDLMGSTSTIDLQSYSIP